MCWLSGLFRRTVDVPSPSDVVPRDSIYYYETTNRLEIDLKRLNIPFTKPPKIWTPSIPGTKSMDPIFDKEHNNIYIQGADGENQEILLDWLAEEWFEKSMANIIAYRIPGDLSLPAEIYAVHRLSRIISDNKGRKWYFKGDNNATEDSLFARDSNILFLCIGTIY